MCVFKKTNNNIGEVLEIKSSLMTDCLTRLKFEKHQLIHKFKRIMDSPADEDKIANIFMDQEC